MKRYAELVWSILNNEVKMTAKVFGRNGNSEDELAVEFSEDLRQKNENSASEDEESLYWTARALVNKRPSERYSRRIQLDLDILESLEDILYLLGAFIAPGENVEFRIKNRRGKMLHIFKLQYVDGYATCREEACG